MSKLNVSTDIVPVGEFRSGIPGWLKRVQNTGHPLVITQNGKPAGVLLSPSEYDALVYRQAFLDSVSNGLADIEAGEAYGTDELKEELRRRRADKNPG